MVIPVPATVRARDIVCEIGNRTLRVGLANQPLIVTGELHKRVNTEDSMWTLEDHEDGGKCIAIDLQKQDRMSWWKCVMAGDPEIDTTKVEPENSKLSDLDGETRSTVEKMMVGRCVCVCVCCSCLFVLYDYWCLIMRQSGLGRSLTNVRRRWGCRLATR